MTLLPLYKHSREQQAHSIISECLKGSVPAQRQLFEMFYSEGMNTALRYSDNHEDAKEILANAFIRVFEKLDQFDPARFFLPWFRKIIVHASSDYYRYHHETTLPLDFLPEPVTDDRIIDDLCYHELLELIQKLPPALRVVFNLYCVEGFKHQEIAEMLHISPGTSKSNLHRAKSRLQQMIIEFSKHKGLGPLRKENKENIIKGT